MNFVKKAGAVLLALCSVISCSSCGENTANVMTVSDRDVRAGIYLYYATSAYNEAIEVLRKGGENFDEIEDSKGYEKILSKADIDGKTAEEWIQDKAEEYCKTYIAIEQEFDALGLTLSGDQIAAADANTTSSMTYYGEFFSNTGIGEQSVKDILLNSYKQDALWNAYYGEGGSKDIQEQTLYDHYKDNHFRLKYIEMPLKDGEGNLLKADGKEEIEKMANDYLKRLGKKAKNEADLMAEFDFLIDEHANYVTSLSEAAVTTTDEEGNTITTPTTAKITTDKDGNTGTTATTAPEKDEDAEDTSGAEDEESTTTTTTAVEEAEEEEGVGYDTAKERVLAVSTAPAEAEKKDETTTEPSYTPCEKVYNWAVDPDTKYLKPELIKDEECYYVVVKMDIEDRMTGNDLWNANAIENVRQEMYYEEFLDMLNQKGKDMETTRNSRAFKRYKVLDIDIMGYKNALMQSYYSMYGGGY
ncbi:MAG: hypothetical protein IKQ91_07490 [Oscillospiraceae bacterium]|nr:hypothetical protein [Oscillospiraceae bacterium]